MADLEALTRIETPDPRSAARETVPGQYTWRYLLPENKRISLGSSADDAEWVVPEDKMISRRHAYLEWSGGVLKVTRRGIELPGYPNVPQNHIWFHNKPVEQFEVRVGEWFVIGQTRFTVRGESEVVPESPVDATVVRRQAERDREELQKLPFTNPVSLLKAMEMLPKYLEMVTNESALFRQMLKVILKALPQADGAAVVRIPPDCPPDGLRVSVIEQNVRHALPAAAGEFVPSRKLVRRAVREQKKSCLHIWSTDPGDFTHAASAEHSITLGAMHQQGATPWAICTPFKGGTGYALYVSGRLVSRDVPDSSSEAAVLTENQKFTEIIVGLLETTLRNLQLTRQNAVIREAWPRAIHKHLNDPEKLERMLRPAEKDVTVLFCDLRNYSGFAEEKGESLADAWREIQQALDTMSGAVTERDGIVAGFRGDAVLGFWGWPELQADQVQKAMEAALRIHEKLSGRLVQRKCGLGLTHGRALAGRLGAHDLAVLDLYGPVVNLAFRLEEMTKAFGVGIVVSEEFVKQLNAHATLSPRWRTRLLGRVRPRGMKVPLKAYELFPAGDMHDRFGTEWMEAVELFTKGDWTEAYSQLDDIFSDDLAAQCIMRHMDRTRRKPPLDWDGAFLPRPPEI